MQHDIRGRETTQPGLPLATQTPSFAMRLLIIEDDRDAADYLVKAFREVGHMADRATDGEEGLALALDGQYDVLIVDRMLPKLDGLSVIGALRGKSVDTPVLILSALGQVVTRTMLLENVWDYHFDPQTNVIDVHISRLRSKIDKGFAQPLLHTVRGAGYMIRDEVK